MSAPSPPELRPLPVSRTIHWVPDGDAAATPGVVPGIVAAVEALVVERAVLRDVALHCRAAPARALGVLHGAIYRCPNLHLDYLLVEGVQRADPPVPVTAEDARRDALAALVAALQRDGKHAVGWYRGGASHRALADAGDVAVQTSLFAARWAAALVPQRDGRGLAFLRLTPHRRPYVVPFYELLPLEPRQDGEPASTAMSWSTYHASVATELVAELARAPQGSAPFSGPAPDASTRPHPAGESGRHPRISGRVAPFVPRSGAPDRAPSEDDTSPTLPAMIAPVPPASLGGPTGAEVAPPDAAPASPPPPAAPSDVDRLFDEPPPAHLAGDFAPGERRARPPTGWHQQTAWRLRGRRRPGLRLALLLAIGLAGAWFVVQHLRAARAPAPGAALGSGIIDSAQPRPGDPGAAVSADSAGGAAMARFASARLDASIADLERELRVVTAALDTTGYGTLAPGACAVADSAHTRALLDADAITLAQRYLDHPLDGATHRRVGALLQRADRSTLLLHRTCP